MTPNGWLSGSVFVLEAAARAKGLDVVATEASFESALGINNRAELAALYLAADVMMVTPLRDGMNLVAKEYVACHPAGDGALVLSEFAGAARELGGAVLMNPYDPEAVRRALETTLSMHPTERRRRMRSLAAHVARTEGVQLIVTDRQGRVLVGHSTKSSPRALVSAARDPRVQAALAGRSGVTRSTTTQGDALSAYVPVTGLDWTVTA